jgi:hypothetical protein
VKSLFVMTFAALTVASLATPADARHNFCHRYPDDPRCAAIEDDGYDAEDADEDEEDVFVERRPRRIDRSCQGIGRWLAVNYGYRRIRATDCSGNNYGYEAVRGPWIYIVKVDSRAIRIKSQIRLRRY